MIKVHKGESVSLGFNISGLQASEIEDFSVYIGDLGFSIAAGTLEKDPDIENLWYARMSSLVTSRFSGTRKISIAITTDLLGVYKSNEIGCLTIITTNELTANDELSKYIKATFKINVSLDQTNTNVFLESIYRVSGDGIGGGEDGLTPFINASGNWQIGTEDTGVKAQGEDGLTPQKGTDYVDGEDGLTPFINTSGNWQIGDVDTGVKAQGEDGITPQKGTDYVDGEDGLTPFINQAGNWQIGDTDTGVKALGEDGKDFITPKDPFLLAEYRFDEDVKTVLIDYSGNSKNGTYVGNPTSVSGGGFYAENGKYATGHVDSLSTAQTIYIVADISEDNKSLYHAILGNSTGLSNLNIMGTEITNGNHWQGAHVTSVNKLSQTFQPTPTNTYIIAITVPNNGSVLSKTYYNGEEVSAYVSRDTNIYLGRNGTPWFGQSNANGVGRLNANIYYFASYSSLHEDYEVLKTSNNIRSLLNSRGTKKPESYNLKSTENILLGLGDSITDGAGAGSYLGKITVTESFKILNKGWAGITSGNCINGALGFPTLYLSPKKYNIAVLFFGTNDIGNNTAKVSLVNLKASASLFKRAGWKVIVCSLIDRGDALALNYPNFYTEFNTEIRTSWKYFADEFADLNAEPLLGDVGASSNTTYFQGDKVHPTDAGQQLIASIISAAINKIV
ncbi:SGNH/GDSL hydrolase family protein [Flavobacterium algicola]|uniref:SGNH/GDSL hydrolase family protein n=1 Tax=Flavobacterium algicola TaxID=556529 RepID=UPI001EFDEAF0|nr:SGNH/GDSL hydrolase family protein [Flavobacterium algicola]MCG9792469.1 SGNH/GDSL hydrolase family protein [Flavobacterium algicola]